MSDSRENTADFERDSEVPGESVRDLLRGALANSSSDGDVPDLTRGFQKKLRERSGGKFYADGWSTVKHPPLTTYLGTSLMMLFVVAVLYALLAPLSGRPAQAPPAKPVQVLPQSGNR